MDGIVMYVVRIYCKPTFPFWLLRTLQLSLTPVSLKFVFQFRYSTHTTVRRSSPRWQKDQIQLTQCSI
jgi:hypothetical protein